MRRNGTHRKGAGFCLRLGDFIKMRGKRQLPDFHENMVGSSWFSSVGTALDIRRVHACHPMSHAFMERGAHGVPASHPVYQCTSDYDFLLVWPPSWAGN